MNTVDLLCCEGYTSTSGETFNIYLVALKPSVTISPLTPIEMMNYVINNTLKKVIIVKANKK